MPNLPNGGDGAVIKDQKQAPVHHSTFPLNQKHATSLKFGQVTPFTYLYTNPRDKVSLRSLHNLRTLSLKSPLLQNVRMNKDFYTVPMRALLPINFDRLYNNPVASAVGSDDIDAEVANTTVLLGYRQTDSRFLGAFNSLNTRKGLMGLFSDVLYQFGPCIHGGTTVTTSNVEGAFLGVLRLLSLTECLFANDSLFARFRIPLNKMTNAEDECEEFKACMWKVYHSLLIQYGNLIKAENATTAPFMVHYLNLCINGTTQSEIVAYKTYNLLSLKDRMQLYYDYVNNASIQLSLGDAFAVTAFENMRTELGSDYLSHNLNVSEVLNPGFAAYVYKSSSLNTFIRGDRVLNIAPILAYQLVCAEYFTNDHVDNVFSAQDYREFIGAFVRSNVSQYKGYLLYEYNGVKYDYDAFSAQYLSALIGEAAQDTVATISTFSTYMAAYTLFLNLFSPKRSLRYVDVFTGSKVQPLAVGDVNVVVTSNKVSAVDITKSIQMQRFLNQVNRVGARAKNYIQGLFGVAPRDRNDVPVKIGHIDEVCYSTEVQNTAEAQTTTSQSITSNLQSRGGNFAFEMDFTEPSIIIGVASFEVARFYNDGLDQFALKVDRYDMFNPYFQYTGDQSLPVSALDAEAPDDQAFGYVGRYMEYKTSVDYATGAFIKLLQSWIFSSNLPKWSPSVTSSFHISPEFIRAYETELDDYYIDSTATQAENRFQFLCLFDTKIEASRDMVFNPQILG